jgi:hypothetical protein
VNGKLVAMETKIKHFKCISYHAKILKFSFGHKDLWIVLELYNKWIVLELYNKCIVLELYNKCIVLELYNKCIVQ